MKTLIPPTALVVLFASSSAFAQTPAYSKPSGYTTQNLAANSFNLVGINVQTPPVVAGTLTDVNGANLTDTDVDFTSTLDASRTYVLEIKSGPGTADGTVQDFASWTGNTITLPGAISGITLGDSYSVRVAPTLGEVFTGTSITAGFTSLGADIVWIPNGSGGYAQYWKNSTNWRQLVAGNNSDPLANDVSLLYIDGILVQKRASASSLVLTGEVKTTGSNTVISTGFNPISLVAPAGSTLFNCGLIGDLAAAFTALGSDVVWVPTGPNTYDKYALRAPAPGTWYKLNASDSFEASPAADIELPPTILIQRRTAGKVITLDVPPSYSDL